MFRTDDMVGGEAGKVRPKRVNRKGIRMIVSGQEIVNEFPVEEYLKSDLAIARAAEALKGKTFLDV